LTAKAPGGSSPAQKALEKAGRQHSLEIGGTRFLSFFDFHPAAPVVDALEGGSGFFRARRPGADSDVAGSAGIADETLRSP